MALYLVEDSSLIDIGNAIRQKINTTNNMSLIEMASAIRSINIDSGDSGNSGETTSPTTFIAEQVHVNSASQGTYVTLLNNNSFISNNYNNTNLFVGLIANNLDSIDESTYSMNYQWVSMFSCNKVLTLGTSDSWYGMGIYLMLGKGYSYPSTLEIPYSLTDTSNTNYSFLNVTSNGDVRVYICGYDVLASGDYTVIAGIM